jgi:glycosyltransferase involved in cell wall biosynthesis
LLQQATLSIVLPCYNPTSGWVANIVAETQALMAETGTDEVIEVIIVNDGSTNAAFREIEAVQLPPYIRLIDRKENFGKGYSLRQGVAATAADRIIFTDIDFPYTRESFVAIYNLLDTADITIGVRDNNYYVGMNRVRVFISRFLRFLIRNTLRISTDDTQCGLKGFGKKGKAMFLQTRINRYLFDLEFIFIGERGGLSLNKVPVKLKEGILLSKMNWKVLLSEGGNFLKIFIKNLF